MLPPLLLSAERKCVVPVLAALVPVCSATCVILDGYENLPCVGAEIANFDAVHFPALEPLARHDNSAVVPVEPSAALPLLLLPAEYTHVAPVPAVWALVCFAVCAFLHRYEDFPCAGAGIADFDAARFPVSAQLGQDVPAAILA